MPKIERRKLSDQVYAALKQMIADYRFKPGTRLNVERIARELAVSRTPVWEAVKMLKQEGLLENIPNRGVFMAVMTPAKALELYAVREVLEAMAARLAAARIDDRTLAGMARCLEKQRRVIEKQDVVGYSQLDFEFHAYVYETSGNGILQELLETIKNKMRPISMHIDPLLPNLLEHHRELVAALQAHDPDKAEEAIRVHNRFMMQHIREEMEAGRWRSYPQGSPAARPA